MSVIEQLQGAVGGAYVLTGADCARYGADWTGVYTAQPYAVARPASTAEVAAVVRIAADHGVPVVPVGGNTGLCGGTHAPDAVMVSLERMNRIREIRPDSRVAVVEAGVVLETLHGAVAEHDLVFPLTFGAKGSAMIGGCLATNAGGSNVLRHGPTRALCLGLEVVLPSGEVLDLMSALHKDNTGYDLKDLFIGAEGTLGIITGAVLKLVPQPAAHATAMVAVPALSDALTLLNRLQEQTGGAVEAFEYMSGALIERLHARIPDIRPPFDRTHAINIMVEVGATAPKDARPQEDGTLPVVARLEEVLEQMLDAGGVVDAVVAGNEAQRAEMWRRRESVAEVTMARPPFLNTDVSVPLEHVESFLGTMSGRLAEIDPGAGELAVAHLGDGNIHFVAYPTRDDDALLDRIQEAVEQTALELAGSFSAEHGIGKSKLASMRRRKNPVALQVMRQIKAALDPDGIMNPGKVLP